jgi:energy-coupling factor transporter transmembrane protein EcfT
MFSHFVPHELIIAGVSIPPLLMSVVLALFLTSLTVAFLNKLRWHRFFVSPPLVELSLVVIYTVLISTFLIPA